jgi:hypothetical protein
MVWNVVISSSGIADCAAGSNHRKLGQRAFKAAAGITASTISRGVAVCSQTFRIVLLQP